MHLLRTLLLSILPLLPFTTAWLPTSPPASALPLTAFTHSNTTSIRGVNLGSLFIVEPWMARHTWDTTLGCAGAAAEFQCIANNYGGDVGAASKAFAKHWATWVTRADLEEMVGAGLNTIRIPVGWWMKEDLVESGEYFPKGGFGYLERLCEHAASLGIYVIIEMHGAPGTQNAHQPFTGNSSDQAYFYQSPHQAARAYDFLTNLTHAIHTRPSFRTVGTLGLLNEPLFNTPHSPSTTWLLNTYYPTAIARIRTTESTLSAPTPLHLALMDDLWHDLSGATDPAAHVPAAHRTNLLFDDHNYQREPVAGMTRDGVVAYACADRRETAAEARDVKVVGEWAMAVGQRGEGWTPEVGNKGFWARYFSAQQWRYERDARGWVWWAWKVEVEGAEDWLRWSYKGLVENGIVGRDLNAQLAASPCRG